MFPLPDNRISTRAKLTGGVALATVALALWKFVPAPADQSVAEPPDASPERSPPPAIQAAPAPPIVEPSALNETTLPGTKWEREGFGIEFAADGKLLIGGRERARWRVEGSRIRLYRDSTGEEHWLDIAGNKLMWKDQEIARIP